MMRSRTALILAVLLLAGCRTYTGEEDTTNDFSFDITQTKEVPVMSGQTRVDVPFAITIGNRTNAPVKVENIGIQSFEAGDYQIPFRSRPFETVIEPGQKATLEFWANAIVTDSLLGTTQPLTIRSMVDFSSTAGNRHEVFVRGINGVVGLGLQKPVG